MHSLSQAVSAILFLSFSLPIVGSRAPHSTTIILKKRPADLVQIQNNGKTLFAAGKLNEAISRLEIGRKEAQKRKDKYEETCFDLALGNCHLRTHHYRKAIAAYTAGNEIALSNGYSDLAILLASNRATIYRQMANNNAALQSLRSVSHLIGLDPDPLVLLQIAKTVSNTGDFESAAALAHSAAYSASNQNRRDVEATVWNQLGFMYLEHGELQKADDALVRAFRLRKLLAPRDLPSSYIYLGMLRREQGDPQSSLNLFARAMEAGISRGQLAPPFFFFQRAQAKADMGKLDESLDDFRQAVRLAREWRFEVLPADSFRISAESGLQQIYSAFIQTGMKLYQQTGNQRLAQEMFEVSEENRAVSMRQGMLTAHEYPDEYWENLAKLRSAYAASLDNPSQAVQERIAALRLKLAEIEVGLGLAKAETTVHSDDPSGMFERTQRSLADSEALISFQWAPSTSYVWALTRSSYVAAPVAGSANLKQHIEKFREAIRSGDKAGVAALGGELYSSLFGSIERTAKSKPDWLLLPDGPLWELPFSALRAGATTGEPGYLMSSHSIRLLPAALLLESSVEPVSGAGAFVGIGDAVYNAADPRMRGIRQEKGSLQFARLPGSGKEIGEAATCWNGEKAPVLLTGFRTGRSSVQTAISHKPAAVHFATHVVQQPAAKDQVMIALGFQSNGEPEFLAPTDISSWRHALGLVVLSGCGSGQGVALPGSGLLGLTRAWLLSGAQSVAATYWPIPDDASPFFTVFYRNLRKRTDPVMSASGSAEALRAAQSAMLRSGDWRSSPAYWSSFFVVGRN